ncbi:MAG: hypothetical protein ACTSSI_18435 [Candidatus Helarchaeota archaeon]
MIRNLWIILESGANLFQKNFGDKTTLDESLISGLFLALTNFAKSSGAGDIDSGLFLALTNFAKSSGAGDIDSINLKKVKFIYQHAGQIIVVLGIDAEDDSEAIKKHLDEISHQ